MNGWCTEKRLVKETSKHANTFSYIRPPPTHTYTEAYTYTHTHTHIHILPHMSNKVPGVLDYKAGNTVTM